MAGKNKGRQKVEMVKMSNERTLQATFSKRRSSIFKKASELCTLCDVEVAVVVFSPGKKVFSFGHPCVESVVDHFLTGNPPQSLGSLQSIVDRGNSNIHELNMQLSQILDELEVEKKRGAELVERRKASQRQCWWEAPIDQLDTYQLAELKARLESLKNNVILQAQNVVMQPSTCSQHFGESSSGGGLLQVPPTNTSNNNMVPPPPPPPPMLQSASPSQYFVENSSTEDVIPLGPTVYNFNPSNRNVMPPPPPPPPPPHQHHPPQRPHPHSGFNPGLFNYRFY